MIAKVKWEILDLLGYVFCEASFRWWNLADDEAFVGLSEPTWKDQAVYWIGVPSYRIGCFFYNLQDDGEINESW